MNNDNKLIPNYRFPEFKDDGSWKISPLSDKIDYERPDKYIVKNTNYINEGTPVLTANKSFILGYTDENEGVYKDYLPVIIFDDFTVDNKYVDFPFKVKSSAIKILKNKNENDSLKFFYELISQIKFDAKEHKRYYISSYQKIEVPIPSSPAEQQKIAACLSSLDDVIAGHEEKLTTLEEHKKGLMQNLFPKEGETQPKYRFPEFVNDGDWVGNVLDDVFSFVRGPFGGALKKDIFVKEGYAVYEQSHAIYNDFSEFRYYINPDKYKELIRFSVKPNDLIMSCSGTMGKFALVPENCTEGVINQALLKLSAKKGFSILYLKYLMETDLYQNKLLSQSAGGAIKNVVGVNEIKLINIYLPKNPLEQQKIASVLSSVDELIAGQREKIEALKEYKTGLMQGLFPKIET